MKICAFEYIFLQKCGMIIYKGGVIITTTGQKIKAARKAAGMTQAELADKLGIAYTGIAQWERDKRNPKYETLKRIAAALGVEWTELVPEEEPGPTIVPHVFDKLKAAAGPPPRDRAVAALDQMTAAGQTKVAEYAEDILPRHRRRET